MFGARLVIWLGLPLGALALAVSMTMLLSWQHGFDLCATWLAPILPYCAR